MKKIFCFFLFFLLFTQPVYSQRIKVSGGGGDSVQVAGSDVDTTANFVNDGNVDFTLTDGGAGGPDTIKADYTETDPNALLLDQTTPQSVTGGTPTFEDIILSETDSTLSIDDVFDDILNRGLISGCAVTDEGGLNVTWTAGVIYDRDNEIFVNITAQESNVAVTNNSPNYLKWVSGTTLTLDTTVPTTAEVGIARICAQAGDIVGIISADIVEERTSNLLLGIGRMFPVYVLNGMVISEDTDVTNALDVVMSAGTFLIAGRIPNSPSQIYSRTSNLTRHFHSSGAWTTDTNAQIDTTNYDNGSDLAAIPAAQYVKSMFYYSNSGLAWVYPTATYLTKAAAIAAPRPTVPPGLVNCVPLMALIYQKNDASLPTAGGEQWIDERPSFIVSSVGDVIDHSSLQNLNWNSAGHVINSGIDMNSNALTEVSGVTINDGGTIGLGSGKGLIQFDDETTDTISLLNCDVGIGTAPSYPFHVVSTANAGASLDYLVDCDWQGQANSNGWMLSGRFYTKNTGSNAPAAGYHVVPLIGWGEDTATGEHDFYGVEGRVDGHSEHAGITYFGFVGLPKWFDLDSGDGSTFAGNLISIRADRQVLNYDQATARNEGTVIGVDVPDAVGGANNYGFRIQDQTAGSTVDVGLAIGGADTYAFWLGYGADNTDAANGITFGASVDTNLYRSAANTLKTDDSFEAVGNIAMKATAAQGYVLAYGTGGTHYIEMHNDNAAGYVGTTVGNLNLTVPSGSYVAFNTDTGVAPLTDGVALGISSFEWGTAYINQILSDTGAVDFGNENITTTGIITTAPSSDQTIAAATTIQANANIVRVVGNGGAVTCTSDPTVSNGTSDGQEIKIFGTHDINTVTIQDESNNAGSTLELSGGNNFTLGLGDSIYLIWDSGDSKWYEVSRSDN